MIVLNKHKIAVFVGIGLATVTVLAARLVWGQTAPVLAISQTSSNAVLVTVTNGASTGQYQIYWTEFLTEPDWLLLTNGSIGQTQFLVPMEDWETTFFSASSAFSSILPASSTRPICFSAEMR